MAALGPLALAAGNLGEYWIGDVALLVALAAGMAWLVTLLRRLLLRRLDEQKGSALDLVAIAALTLPFLLAQDLARTLPFALGARETLVLTGLGAAALVVVILRRPQPPRRALSVLAVAAGILCAVFGGRVLWAELALRRALGHDPLARQVRAWNADSVAGTLAATVKPDVYLVVLDAYAGDELLQREYGIDHRPLRDSLAALGFQPYTQFSSNYARTFASLASLLNFTQVNQVGADIVAAQHAGFLRALITHSRTPRLFRELGYEVHWVPAPYFGGRRLAPGYAEVHRSWRSGLASLWTDSDLISAWLSRVWAPGVVLRQAGLRIGVRSAVDSAVALLPRLARDGRPTFAIVHLFATHEPLSYDPSCGAAPDAVARFGQRAAYAAAVRCFDRQLLPLFRELIAAAQGEVIIAATGDHAPSSLRADLQRADLDTVAPQLLAERFDVTAFVHLPPRLRSAYQPPASAANLVPALVNAAFNGALPRQPDTRYFSRARPANIYDFRAIR